ncbi:MULTISPECIES: hypothetical protein [Streptomyces]|uniref:DUF5602 domain-containing protein n=1 Tax=Streptomyces ramulosus TaxID=47762 RepID=A0ABW1FBP4_9ACTN
MKISGRRARWSLLGLACGTTALIGLAPMVSALGTPATGPATRAAGAGAAEDGGDLPALTLFNKVSLGDGFVQTLYATDDTNHPKVLAVKVDAAAMKTLPTTPTNDGQTCFDKDNNGIDLETDCASGHERDLWFPKLPGLPFQWMMFDWQRNGHGPSHVFDKPHFDFHFFMQDFTERNKIRTGPCNLVINCDDEKTAMKPVPEQFMPPGWGMPGAAGRMGNHIIDPNAAPANGGPFTQAFAYGTWDGHVTYWEPVVNKDWITTEKPAKACQPITQAPEVETTGYYPTQMCTRYSTAGDVTFTLENFTSRTAPDNA